ncbi:hypothetical protein HDIA_3234 [Hartmannibacter diazotrophicus]|uniref:Uncharacterized protein n=1 Tax=Hartmannibacter diazotrophicus TaxID=1482074 RepID=A0A2C9DAZ5_9HYPH|nr:hypothetical protein [Hartmannibacter diazotrophicus]SON56775.1 hypothetical protein HDIA_3234 [Hartmannibacter diazotrophicus]
MARVSTQDIRRVCGALPERKIQEILECDAELEELEEAVAWASGDNEHTPCAICLLRARPRKSTIFLSPTKRNSVTSLNAVR